MKKGNNTILSRLLQNKVLFLVLLLGLAMRGGFFLAVRPWDPEVTTNKILIADAPGYHALAKGIIAQGSFKDFGVKRTPGYPFFLSLVYGIFGVKPWAVLLLQVFIGALSIALLYGIGKMFFDRRTVLAACFLYAIEPHAVIYTSYLLTETLFCAIFLASLYLLLRGVTEQRLWYIALSGMSMGLATLVRPITQFFPLIVVVFLLLMRRRLQPALKEAAVFVLLFAVALFPWVYRNHALYGSWGLTSIGGYNLLFFNAAYTEQSVTGRDVELIKRELDERARASMLPYEADNPFARSNQYKRMAFEYISDHPFAYAVCHTRGIINMFINLTATQICNLLSFKTVEKPYDFIGFTSYREMIQWFFTYKTFQEIAVGTVIAVFLMMSYVTALIGSIKLLRSRQYFYLFFTGMIILYISALTGVVGVSRYKLPFVPLYLLLSAYGLAALWDFRKRTTFQPMRAMN